MKSLIWISFDLGIQGDYDGIYSFLDSLGARECGDSVGVIQFEFKRDLLAELKGALSKAVNLDKRSRVYVIFPDDKGKYKGRFLVGGRKRSPWSGYGAVGFAEEDTLE
jgi:hypothetical protein